MCRNAHKVGFQILQGNIIRRQITDQVFMIAVVYVEDGGAVRALQGQRQLCPVVLVGVFHESDLYVGMNGRVFVNHCLKQVGRARPVPEFNGDVLPVVDRNGGIILNGASNDRIAFGRGDAHGEKHGHCKQQGKQTPEIFLHD